MTIIEKLLWQVIYFIGLKYKILNINKLKYIQSTIIIII